jgi:hypothetical protein
VDKFDREGKFVAEVLGPGVLNLPGKMIMNGDDLVVVDRVTNTVLIYDTKAGKHRRWDYAFEEPGCIACDPRGNIWVGSNTSGPNPKGATILIFDSRYQFVRNVRFRKSRQPVSIAFAKDQVLIADQDARNVLAFSEDGTFAGSLREQPYDAQVCSVQADSAGNIYVGVAPVVDLHWVEDLGRLYYIDFDTSSVCYSSGYGLRLKP